MNAETISIVIIEKQPLMLAALSAALVAENLNVIGEVTESSQAIGIIHQLKPRLILFSVGTPSLPDMERISALRYEFPDLLILALVNGEFLGQERMALDYGAHRAINITTPRAELLRVIMELLQGKLPPAAPSHST